MPDEILTPPNIIDQTPEEALAHRRGLLSWGTVLGFTDDNIKQCPLPIELTEYNTHVKARSIDWKQTSIKDTKLTLDFGPYKISGYLDVLNKILSANQKNAIKEIFNYVIAYLMGLTQPGVNKANLNTFINTSLNDISLNDPINTVSNSHTRFSFSIKMKTSYATALKAKHMFISSSSTIISSVFSDAAFYEKATVASQILLMEMGLNETWAVSNDQNTLVVSLPAEVTSIPVNSTIHSLCAITTSKWINMYWREPTITESPSYVATIGRVSSSTRDTSGNIYVVKIDQTSTTGVVEFISPKYTLDTVIESWIKVLGPDGTEIGRTAITTLEKNPYADFDSWLDIERPSINSEKRTQLKLQLKERANADFTFFVYSPPPNDQGTLGFATFPGDIAGWTGTVFNVRRPNYSWTDSLEPGGYGFITIVHEIGHTLGLSHPHNEPYIFPTTGVFDPGRYLINQVTFTIMSYSDTSSFRYTNKYIDNDGQLVNLPTNTYGVDSSLNRTERLQLYNVPGIAAKTGFAMGPMALDAYAIYWLYGLPIKTGEKHRIYDVESKDFNYQESQSISNLVTSWSAYPAITGNIGCWKGKRLYKQVQIISDNVVTNTYTLTADSRKDLLINLQRVFPGEWNLNEVPISNENSKVAVNLLYTVATVPEPIDLADWNKAGEKANTIGNKILDISGQIISAVNNYGVTLTNLDVMSPMIIKNFTLVNVLTDNSNVVYVPSGYKTISRGLNTLIYKGSKALTVDIRSANPLRKTEEGKYYPTGQGGYYSKINNQTTWNDVSGVWELNKAYFEGYLVGWNTDISMVQTGGGDDSIIVPIDTVSNIIDGSGGTDVVTYYGSINNFIFEIDLSNNAILKVRLKNTKVYDVLFNIEKIKFIDPSSNTFEERLVSTLISEIKTSTWSTMTETQKLNVRTERERRASQLVKDLQVQQGNRKDVIFMAMHIEVPYDIASVQSFQDSYKNSIASMLDISSSNINIESVIAGSTIIVSTINTVIPSMIVDYINSFESLVIHGETIKISNISTIINLNTNDVFTGSMFNGITNIYYRQGVAIRREMGRIVNKEYWEIQNVENYD